MYFHSSVARRVASAAMGGGGIGSLSDPLIPKDDREREACEQEEKEETPIPLSSLGVILGAVLLGAAGLAASAMSMVTAAGMVAVYVAGGFGVLNSLTVVKNQYEISKAEGYRQGANLLRKEANRLTDEVDALIMAVNELETEASLMKTFESQLSDIARQQGISVDKIVNLTRENEEILARQKANLKQTFLSDIAKAFISSEFLTGEMKVDIKNLPILMMRLQIQLNSHGMQLDAKEFEKMVNEDDDVGHIIKKCGEMINTEGNGSSLVTLAPEITKGSLEVARGEKPSLKAKPKLIHRNTVVRDVKRGLSMKGIEIYSDSDSSISSGFDEEADRLFGTTPRSIEPRSNRKHRASKKEPIPKVSYNFKAVARIASFGRDEETRGDARPAQKKSDIMGKFKSASMAVSSVRHSTISRRGSQEAETTSHGSRASRSSKDAASTRVSSVRSSSKSKIGSDDTETASHGSRASRSSRDTASTRRIARRPSMDNKSRSSFGSQSSFGSGFKSKGKNAERAKSADRTSRSGSVSNRGGSTPRVKRNESMDKQTQPPVRNRRHARDSSF